MILKIKNQAFELYRNDSDRQLEINPTVKELLQQKFVALQKGLLITDDLIGQADQFIMRNLVVEDERESYCPRCLKAHIIKKATESGIDNETMKIIEHILPGEVGHNGYYMDQGKLMKI